jgi:hypothetical protein
MNRRAVICLAIPLSFFLCMNFRFIMPETFPFLKQILLESWLKLGL